MAWVRFGVSAIYLERTAGGAKAATDNAAQHECLGYFFSPHLYACDSRLRHVVCAAVIRAGNIRRNRNRLFVVRHRACGLVFAEVARASVGCGVTSGNGRVVVYVRAGEVMPRHSPNPVRAKPSRSQYAVRIASSPCSRKVRVSPLGKCSRSAPFQVSSKRQPRFIFSGPEMAPLAIRSPV